MLMQLCLVIFMVKDQQKNEALPKEYIRKKEKKKERNPEDGVNILSCAPGLRTACIKINQPSQQCREIWCES